MSKQLGATGTVGMLQEEKKRVVAEKNAGGNADHQRIQRMFIVTTDKDRLIRLD